MPIKATGFGELAKELDEAAKAIQALDGALTEVRFDPGDPASVEGAISGMQAAIDKKVAAYRGNAIVESWIAEIKAKYRQELLDRAAEARAGALKEEEMGDEPAIYRRLNNAVFDLTSASYQTYGEAIKKLARLLHSPEIEPVNNRLTQGIDLNAWLRAGEDTKGSWIGSAKLTWPEEHTKELGTVILLIDKFASDADAAHQFSYAFYYQGNNITSNLANMTRQLIVPFVRDYIAHLKEQGSSPMKKAEHEAPIVSSASMRAHPIHTLVGWSTTIMGLVLVAFGVFALWRGSEGATEINILGSSFKSSSIGAVAGFLGVVLLIFNYRRLLTSVERLR